MPTFKRNDARRFRLAYLKIKNGLTLQQIAAELGLNPKTVEYYWVSAQRVIRGLPPAPSKY